jgi:hypothetical protein
VNDRASAAAAAPAAAVSAETLPPAGIRSAVTPGRGWRIGFLVLQLVLALFVMYRFRLESRTFFDVMLLATGGFVVHAQLPLRFRQPFFVALSLASIIVVLGWLDGIAVIAFGLVLIGICHLRIALRWRVLLLAAAGCLFALWRLELVPAPWSVAVWPVLGAMFMFRLAVYLYALTHDEKNPAPAPTLAYFFMLPNACFPLFPVVDYSTFRRTYYDRDELAIYQTGLKWIVRGLVHLIAYRFVYVHLASDPADIRSLGDLVQFVLATFLLYLRVSGQFHLITGILHLFGYRLPETHHLYYLASSFTDFWRRINIYWKDFMMKLVYYPSFFALRRHGNKLALVVATIVVFAATWILHSYQWFWLRGGFPIEPQDGLFWGFLGVLVVIGSLRELRKSRSRAPARAAGWSASLALRTVGTFTAICVLWSLWSAQSVMEWLVMWGAAGTVDAYGVGLLAALLAIGLAVGGKPWPVGESQASAPPRAWSMQTLLPGLTLVALIVIASTDGYSGVAPRAAEVVASLQRSTLNARDANLQHKGYYENLDNESRQSAQLWEVRAKKPADWIPLGNTAAYRTRPDFVAGELVPDVHIRFMDKPFSTNRWGMRDVERTHQKPGGVFRIAVLGPSHVMGSGVADDETFTRMLETRLNASPDLRPWRFEVLNFGVGSYSLVRQLALLGDRVFDFDPDVVFVTDTQELAEPIVQQLAQTVASGVEIPYPSLASTVAHTGVGLLAGKGIPVPFDGLRRVFELAGIHTRMPWHEAERRLRVSSDALMRATFDDIGRLARQHGAVPVFVALDIVRDPNRSGDAAIGAARNAGLLAFDLLGLWNGLDQSSLRIAEWDNHQNAKGNGLVADRLLALIIQHRRELGLPERQP